ncbi:hypothetical protein PAXRUDRAFT_176939, partial [Paxillus rubicundulus Ve08.2h10]
VEGLYAQDSNLYLDEVCIWLAIEHNITIIPSALLCNLKAAGLTQKMLQKLASECNEVHCADFIGDSSESVVVDETSKNECVYAQHYGQAVQRCHAHIHDVFTYGGCYLLYAALTVDGYLSAQAIEGLYDTEEFYISLWRQL